MLVQRTNDPTAVLLDPVLLERVPTPTLVLNQPMSFSSCDPLPTAVFCWPSVVLRNACAPKAVLYSPMVWLLSAPLPPAVLPWASDAVGFGGAAPHAGTEKRVRILAAIMNLLV